MFPSDPPRETLRFSGNKINCFPRDQSVSVLLVYSLYSTNVQNTHKVSDYFKLNFYLDLSLATIQLINTGLKFNLRAEEYFHITGRIKRS